MAKSLTKNTQLTELFTDGFNWDVSPRGWGALSNILCNKSSIIDTYQSNHTLQRVCQRNMELVLTDDLQSLLELNRSQQGNRSQPAAAQKIIKTHFTGRCINLKPFVDMELNVLPHALAWIVRNARCGDFANGFSLLYQFVQNMHLLFECGSDTPPPMDEVPVAKRRRLGYQECPSHSLTENAMRYAVNLGSVNKCSQHHYQVGSIDFI